MLIMNIPCRDDTSFITLLASTEQYGAWLICRKDMVKGSAWEMLYIITPPSLASSSSCCKAVLPNHTGDRDLPLAASECFDSISGLAACNKIG